MKQFTLLASASILLTASLLSSTTFADISLKGEVLPSTITYDWTGFYAGLNVGVVKHTLNMTDNQASSFDATIQQVSNLKLTGGIQVGYRRQLDLTRASGVYGVEFSANYANAKFEKEYGSPFALYQLRAKNELKNVCLLQLIGGIAADRTLLFLAAGLSWSNISGSVTNLDSIPFFNAFSVAKKALGSALGGGIEYAFSDAMSARFKVDVITPNAYTTSNNVGNRYQISNNIVQASLGLNYTFA